MRALVNDKGLAKLSARLRESLPQFTHDPIDALMAPQEALDFLLMAAGLKPTYVIRGFDPPGWRDLIRGLASQVGAKAIEGPGWTAENPYDGRPEWAQELFGGSWSEPPCDALYVTGDSSVAREVEKICRTGGHPSVEQEARLLGYPQCCVTSHYDKQRHFAGALESAFLRTANGDLDKIRRMVQEDTAVELTPDEQTAMDRISSVSVVPFSSVNMCPRCNSSSTSPAKRQAEKSRRFLEKLDPILASWVSQAHRKAHGAPEQSDPLRELFGV